MCTRARVLWCFVFTSNCCSATSTSCTRSAMLYPRGRISETGVITAPDWSVLQIPWRNYLNGGTLYGTKADGYLTRKRTDWKAIRGFKILSCRSYICVYKRDVNLTVFAANKINFYFKSENVSVSQNQWRWIIGECSNECHIIVTQEIV